MMKKPLVTVIMSVYNTDSAQLEDSIKSILNQTFENFEFIIIDDFSKEPIDDVTNNLQDKRIRLIKNKKNIGLTANLNIGINMSRGKYIARMDSDDISMPNRLKKQIKYMESNPEIGVLGTRAQTIGSHNRVFKGPTNHEDIKAYMLLNNPIVHPSAMIRSSLLKENLYNEKYTTSQDYELWSRLIWKTKFSNLEEVLLKYRIHDNQISVKKNSNQVHMANQIREFMLKKIKPKLINYEINLLQKSARFELMKKLEIKVLKEILDKIIFENRKEDNYFEESLINIFSKHLDKSNYLYAKNSQTFPLKSIKLSSNHKFNKYTYQKYFGFLTGKL